MFDLLRFCIFMPFESIYISLIFFSLLFRMSIWMETKHPPRGERPLSSPIVTYHFVVPRAPCLPVDLGDSAPTFLTCNRSTKIGYGHFGKRNIASLQILTYFSHFSLVYTFDYIRKLTLVHSYKLLCCLGKPKIKSKNQSLTRGNVI